MEFLSDDQVDNIKQGAEPDAFTPPDVIDLDAASEADQQEATAPAEEVIDNTEYTQHNAQTQEPIDVDAEDEDMKAPSDDDGFPEDQEHHRTTTLDASMQFSSFVLWHPDIPVDTGKDEYFGTISEWMKVAQAVCFGDFFP